MVATLGHRRGQEEREIIEKGTQTILGMFQGSKYPCWWLSMDSLTSLLWNTRGHLKNSAFDPITDCLSHHKTWRWSSSSSPTWWVAPVSHPSFSSSDQVLCRSRVQSICPVMTDNSFKMMFCSLPPEHKGTSPRSLILRHLVSRHQGNRDSSGWMNLWGILWLSHSNWYYRNWQCRISGLALWIVFWTFHLCNLRWINKHKILLFAYNS